MCLIFIPAREKLNSVTLTSVSFVRNPSKSGALLILLTIQVSSGVSSRSLLPRNFISGASKTCVLDSSSQKMTNANADSRTHTTERAVASDDRSWQCLFLFLVKGACRRLSRSEQLAFHNTKQIKTTRCCRRLIVLLICRLLRLPC